MTSREKILAGLAACLPETEEDAKIGCLDCPYGCGLMEVVSVPVMMLEDVRALLKAQTPRLLNAFDFLDNPDADAGGAIPCWKESRKPTRRSGWAVIVYGRWLGDTEGGTCRYWTGKPTEEQTRDMPWKR